MAAPDHSPTNRLLDLGARLDRSAGHLYQQIAAEVAEQIRRGELRPGEAVAPQRELSRAWGVSEVTVRRAMQVLAGQGLIEARAGGGTVVRAPEAPPRAAGRPLHVGIAFADLVDGYPFFQPVLAGLRAGDAPVAVRLFDLPADDHHRGRLDHPPPLADLDGLVMMSPVNLRLLALSQERRLPTVLLFNDVSDGYSCCILPAYAQGVTQAVRHLVERGRDRIAFVTAGRDRFSTARWVEALETAKEAHGLEPSPDLIIHAGYGERHGYEATLHLLDSAHPPRAILYASDFMARGGLLAAHRRGRRVPEDVAIVGAGRVLDPSGWPIPLTTIDLQLESMGELTRKLLHQAATRGQAVPPARHTIPSRLHVGGTT